MPTIDVHASGHGLTVFFVQLVTSVNNKERDVHICYLYTTDDNGSNINKQGIYVYKLAWEAIRSIEKPWKVGGSEPKVNVSNSTESILNFSVLSAMIGFTISFVVLQIA